MRKSADKRNRQQLSSISSNKEFLLKFMSKNYQRQMLKQQAIRSFNFYISKRNIFKKVENERINRQLATVGQQVQVGIMLFSSLISNLEQLSNDLTLFTCLSDTFYLMMQFLLKCLQCFNTDKNCANQDWELIDRVLDLFEILNNNLKSIPEPNRDDNSDKKLQALAWIDELPDITKNSQLIMTDEQKTNSLKQLLIPSSISKYSIIVKSSFECYLKKQMSQMINNLSTLIESSLLNRKHNTIKKSLQLFVKLRNQNHETGTDLIKIFERIRTQDVKVKSIQHYNQVLQKVSLQNYLSEEQVFEIVISMLKQIISSISTQIPRQVVTLLCYLKQLSHLFSQIQNTIKEQNLYQTILSLLIQVSNKLKQDSDKINLLNNACNYMRIFYKNVYNNKCLRSNLLISEKQLNKIVTFIKKQQSTQIQNFILNTFPELITSKLFFFFEQQNNFIMALNLKTIINYINRNPSEDYGAHFLKYYKQSQNKDSINNFYFAVYFCLLSILDHQSIVSNNIINIIIQNLIVKLNNNIIQGILADLILLINLTNRYQYSILKCSAKQFTDKLFSNIQLFSKPLLLPNVTTNQALLFSSHQSIPLDKKIINLSVFLNEKKDLFIKQNSQIFYYILIEINKFSQQTSTRLNIQYQKSQQIETIKRMRNSNNSNVLSICCSSLEYAIKFQNNVQIFHSLTKVFSIVQNNKQDDPFLTNIERLLCNLLQNMYSKYPITDKQILQFYNKKIQKKEGNLELFNQFIAHNKQMHVVKFYSQSKIYLSKLHTFIIQIILRILTKIHDPLRSAQINTPEFKRLHLLYLPVESPYIDKSYLNSDLQLVFMTMYLVTLEDINTPESINKMKDYLLKQFTKIAQFYSSQYQDTIKIVSFKNFNFIKYLLDRFMIKFNEQNSFVSTLLDLLSSDQTVLKHLIEEIKNQNSKFVEEKTILIFKRLQYQVSFNKLNSDDSKTIFSFLRKVNKNCELFTLNKFIKNICDLDNLKSPLISIHICRQLSLMRNLFIPDEDMANVLFEYVAKMYEFYQNLTINQNLLVIIPQMICEVFEINSKSESEISLDAFSDLEKIDRSSLTCFGNRYNNNTPISYYRCAECQQSNKYEQKRYICYACIVSCHQGHTYYYVTTTNSRGGCYCSTFSQGCSLKRNQQDSKKKDIGRPQVNRQVRDYYAVSEIPRDIRQMKVVRRDIRQSRDILDTFKDANPYGRSRAFYDTNPIGSYFGGMRQQLQDHPFSRRQVDRYDKFTYQSRDGQYPQTWMEDIEMDNIFLKTIIQKKMKITNEPIVHKIQEKTQLKPDFLKQKAQKNEMQVQNIIKQQQPISDFEQEQKQMHLIQEAKQNIIRHQSYLLHIFLGIVQQKFMKQNRKVSIHQAPPFKLPTQTPVLAKLSQNSFKIYSTNFKTKMNFEHGGVSPMIIRKPIAISDKLILVLCSLSIHVFEARKFLSHICNFSTNHPEYLYRHDLLLQAHSIEFVPNNPKLLCVAGVKTIHILSIGEDNNIIKAPVNSYDNNSGDVINKIQCLEIGVLIADAKSIKLIDLNSKSILITIPSPKQGGIIRDWSACKQLNSKSVYTYSLLVITSYSIYHLQFDETDRGQKQLSKRLNGLNKQKDEVGSAVYQCNLFDGRKILLSGFKDTQTNLFGIIQSDTLISSTTHKFNTFFNSPSLFGHIELIQSSAERIIFACTLKDNVNRDMCFHSGNLALISLTKSDKLQIHQIQYHTQNLRCQGMKVWNIDKDIQLILSITEDGSVYMHSVGKLLKQNILKYLSKTQDNASNKQDTNKSIDDMKKIVFSNLNLNILTRLQLNPIVQFSEKSEILKKQKDYNIQKGGNLISVHLTNSNKMITGISFKQSTKITLPTRTIDNVLEVGFSTLQCLYFYANGLKFSLQTPSKQILSIDIDSFRSQKNGICSQQFQVFGESAGASNLKIKKMQALISRVSSQNSSMHLVQIFKILEIFLKQIKQTQNYMIQNSQLKSVIDSLKNLLSQVNQQYYTKLRKVIILCLQIYCAMIQQTNLRADNPLHPYTLPTQTVLIQIQSFNILKTNLFLDDLYQLVNEQPQVFFYLMKKYHKLPQKLFKQYSLLFSKDNNDKQRHRQDNKQQIPKNVQKLLAVMVASMNLNRKSSDRDDVLLIIKNIFAKYSGKPIRTILYKNIVKYYFIKPEQWIQKQIKSVEEEVLIEPVVDTGFKNMFFGGKFNITEQQLMQMDEQQQQKFFLMMENIDQIQEQKMDFEEQNQIKQIEEQQPITHKTNIAQDIFIYSMRPYQNQDSYETAHDYILMAYTCFKATEEVSPDAVEKYLAYIAQSLKKINIQKILPPVVVAYLALFSTMIQNSKHLQKQQTVVYNEIKKQIFFLVDNYLQKNQNLSNVTCINLSHVIKFKQILSQKINIPHTLLRLLRKPVEPTPSILYLKCYYLLPENKEFYKVQRDKIIFQKSMRANDINSLYKKAKKSPESWKQFANIQWLEEFIQKKMKGWQQALQLLAISYQ